MCTGFEDLLTWASIAWNEGGRLVEFDKWLEWEWLFDFDCEVRKVSDDVFMVLDREEGGEWIIIASRRKVANLKELEKTWAKILRGAKVEKGVKLWALEWMKLITEAMGGER